jgi:hypothetical protein
LAPYEALFVSAEHTGQISFAATAILVKAVDWKTKISTVLPTKFSYHKSSFCQPYTRLYGAFLYQPYSI